jgi:hypothetical protein
MVPPGVRARDAVPWYPICGKNWDAATPICARAWSMRPRGLEVVVPASAPRRAVGRVVEDLPTEVGERGGVREIDRRLPVCRRGRCNRTDLEAPQLAEKTLRLVPRIPHEDGRCQRQA